MTHDCVDVYVCAHALLLLSHLRLIKRSTIRSQKTNMRSLPVPDPADVTACHLQPGKESFCEKGEKWRRNPRLRHSELLSARAQNTFQKKKKMFSFSQVC